MLIKPPILQAEENRIRKEIEQNAKRKYERPFTFTPLIILGGVAFLSGILSIFQVWIIVVSVVSIVGLILDVYWSRKYAPVITGTPQKEQEEIVHDMEEDE